MPAAAAARRAAAREPTVLGWHANVVFGMIAVASFLCCVTMSMPQQHLVAFCSDLGISATLGAAMLSVLLGMGFFSRQGWGWLSDRIGGLLTALLSSILQCAAMTGFLFTQDEVGLFAVATAFGLGFSALIPAYVLTIRELYPVERGALAGADACCCSAAAAWRPAAGSPAISTTCYGYYLPAFATGVAFNIANIAMLFMLVVRQRTYAGALTAEPVDAQVC